jgi:hypothetical protein
MDNVRSMSHRLKNGVNAAAKDMGVSVDYRAPETFDMVSMGQLIDAAVNQKPDGLIISIPDASALGPSLKKGAINGQIVIHTRLPSFIETRTRPPTVTAISKVPCRNFQRTPRLGCVRDMA